MALERQTTWGWLVVLDIFLGGSGAGVFAVGFVLTGIITGTKKYYFLFKVILKQLIIHPWYLEFGQRVDPIHDQRIKCFFTENDFDCIGTDINFGSSFNYISVNCFRLSLIE